MLIKIQSFINNLFKTILSLLKIILLTRRVQKLHPADNKRTCTILGNGPSLLSTLEKKPTFLSDSSLLCVNFFADTDLYEKFQPERYVINAPEIWRKNCAEVYLTNQKELFHTISNKTNWTLLLYLPVNARNSEFYKKTISPILVQNENIKVCFFNVTPIEGFKFLIFPLFRRNLGMPRPHNVLIPSLMITINSGFEKIFLLGADHSWLKDIWVDENNAVFLRQRHFYQNDPTPKEMHKRGTGTRRLHEVLQKFVYTFSGYFILKDYVEKRGVRIINATPGSYIDAFERYPNNS